MALLKKILGQFEIDFILDVDANVIIPGFRNPQTGQLLQADGVFVNRHLTLSDRGLNIAIK
jgi:hypothetical protein